MSRMSSPKVFSEAQQVLAKLVENRVAIQTPSMRGKPTKFVVFVDKDGKLSCMWSRNLYKYKRLQEILSFNYTTRNGTFRYHNKDFVNHEEGFTLDEWDAMTSVFCSHLNQYFGKKTLAEIAGIQIDTG